MDENKISCTVDGIDVTVDVAQLSSFKVLGLFSRAQKGDMAAAWDFAVVIFGEEQLDEILEKAPDCSIYGFSDFIKRTLVAAAEARGEDPKN